MSEGFIADSSVGVAWAVHSQASDATDELLDRVSTGTPYLELAVRRKLPLASRDEALCQAAQGSRVRLRLM